MSKDFVLILVAFAAKAVMLVERVKDCSRTIALGLLDRLSTAGKSKCYRVVVSKPKDFVVYRALALPTTSSFHPIPRQRRSVGKAWIVSPRVSQ